MNVKYYYEFEGTDKVLNRVEMLCNGSVTPEEIKGGASPFILEYPEVKKLEPVQSSGAKLNLISERVFRFLDLHTDDMQGYLIKFYRGGVLYWIGYLDSELYTEDLSASPPYPVEFSASDFNILERLKFQNEEEKKYTDITTLITQLKRCFDRLNLPFLKLYIGCSTTAAGVVLSASETVLHQLYIQSSNFYDEDGEPMDCREVIESILEPFGLVMVQRDACVYIYDYNTIKAGGVMKCYDFSTLAYQGDVAVPGVLGDLSDIGFASTDATLGFEEMINNTVISCSPYSELPFFERRVDKSSLKDSYEKTENERYYRELYRAAAGWDYNNFVLYQDKKQDSSITGALIIHQKTSRPTPAKPIVGFDLSNYIVGSSKGYKLNIKLDVYFNTKINPFDNEEPVEDSDRTRMASLPCKLFLLDNEENKIKFYNNRFDPKGTWHVTGNPSTAYLEEGGLVLIYTEKNISASRLLNKWVTNSNLPFYEADKATHQGYSEEGVYDWDLNKGVNVILPPDICGPMRLEILDVITLFDPLNSRVLPYPPDKIKDLLINNLIISIVDMNGKEISQVDYEFKSFVNKNVITDFEKKELTVTSCNEEQIPIGKGCILALKDKHFEWQLKYTRGGQTDVLERLLMCTIHSNFTTKNRNISVDIKMTENPAMRYVTYKNIIDSPGMLVKGCSLDFDTAVTRITASDFSEDTALLSGLPYDE